MTITFLRIVYIFSLFVLGVLIVYTFFRPLAASQEYSAIQKEHLIKTQDGWVMQFHLINQSNEAVMYILKVILNNDHSFEESVFIEAKKDFSYERTIRADMVQEKRIRIVVFKEEETSPLDEAVLYLK